MPPYPKKRTYLKRKKRSNSPLQEIGNDKRKDAHRDSLIEAKFLACQIIDIQIENGRAQNVDHCNPRKCRYCKSGKAFPSSAGNMPDDPSGNRIRKKIAERRGEYISDPASSAEDRKTCKTKKKKDDLGKHTEFRAENKAGEQYHKHVKRQRNHSKRNTKKGPQNGETSEKTRKNPFLILQ